MSMARKNKKNARVAKRTDKVVLYLILFFFVICVIIAGVVFLYSSINKKLHASNSVIALYDYWAKRDYRSVYDMSNIILSESPLQNTARTFHGYSGFYLAQAETDNTLAMTYLDDAIISLRIAMKDAKEDSLPQINYMLGKAYFYKNKIANYHFYSDLVIRYLNKSVEAGYSGSDVFEYLGLSYASLNQTQKSIEAFSSALSERESDMLLLSIAEQYCKNNQGKVAKQYLAKVLSSSENENFIIRSHILMGQILTDEADFVNAEKEFQTILQKDENYADAYYALGLLYEKQNDIAKARSEWRKCLKIQPNHAGALNKIKILENR